jgi:TolB protein
MWLKALALVVLALSGASTAWTAVGRESANAPITGVRPTWSPDGKQIAFADIAGSTVNGSWAIFVMNADGTNRRQLVRGSLYPPNGISWSPDGKTLAYDAWVGQDGPTTVYTVPVAGGAATKVTTGWSPAWASANKLVVTDAMEGPNGRDVRLYSVNRDGSGRDTYILCPEVSFDNPMPCGDGDAVFSADGKKIVFDQNVFGAAYAIWTMNADGSGRRQLTPYSPPAQLPDWNPDASAVAYELHDLSGDATKTSIHVMNADGSGDKKIADNASQPGWSPDGKTILFVRAEGGEGTLYAMNADGTNAHALTGPSTTSTTTTTTAPAERCVVPKVVGKTLATARTLLAKARCSTGKVTLVRSAKVAKGRVVAATPKPGRSVAVGTKVALSVSRGKT